MSHIRLRRRDFLLRSIQAGTGVSLISAKNEQKTDPAETNATRPGTDPSEPVRSFCGVYRGSMLEQIAFPMGGMGAGMICLEGTGALSKFSLRHTPDLERDRRVFAAVAIRGRQGAPRVLEGRLPIWKLRPQFPGPDDGFNIRGLPRFREATFEARFPFATVRLEDNEIPLEVSLTGWSPFSPGDADNASLPVAGLEYHFVNHGTTPVEAVFSFNAENFMGRPSEYLPSDEDRKRLDRVRSTKNGFILYGAGTEQCPWDEGYCAAWVDQPNAIVSHAWPLDSLDVLWREFASEIYRARDPVEDSPAAGASVFVPFRLSAGQTKTVGVRLAWYVAKSNLFQPEKGLKNGKTVPYPRPAESYKAWYTARFSGIADVIEYWDSHYTRLQQVAQLFSQTLHDSTLPPEVIEAVAANLSILKSTTVLRQTDGRLWGWEGSVMEAKDDDRTGVSGTTTHVWNYAQAVAHLFPALERGLRETEFSSNQNEAGLQYCRTPLPIRPVEPGHTVPDGSAADGQLGGIIKVYREWRVSGDTQWLRNLWPRVRTSLDYCIRTWDPKHRGWIEEPHLTTYDMDFWGADSLCTSLYLGALKAATLMGEALADSIDPYSQLLSKGVARMQAVLFNGEYFCQNCDWKNLQTSFPQRDDPWAVAYTEFQQWRNLGGWEGPPGQYGSGCLSDGIMGDWLCTMSGIGGVLNRRMVESHLMSVQRHNFKADLTDHANFLRAAFACGPEAGLILCSWPKGGRPTMPMAYSDEVWTGVEYQVASHLIIFGHIEAGVEMVRAVRRRYDGRIRNPFAEVEAGHWYARAMSSYGLLQAFSGARFDAVERVLYLRPALKGDFRSFFSTETGFGTVGVQRGRPFVEVVSGYIPFERIEYTSAELTPPVTLCPKDAVVVPT